MEPKQKRILIVIIYLTVFVAFSLFIYWKIKPEETCVDKIKNQNEEDIDCGGVCAACKKIEALPLEIKESGVVAGGVAGEYDFYAAVNNPNNLFGSSKLHYKITLKDSAGNVLSQREGDNYILPGEKKYIVETGFKSETAPASTDFSITSVDWSQFGEYKKPEIEIVNKNYNEISSGVGFAEAKGLLKNRSPYDFDIIKIEVILKDAGNKVVALNSTSMRTVKSGEERDFRAFWPTRFPGNVQNMEAQVEVNVFDSDTFMKRNYQTHKFQEYLQ
ncbi:MAG: hypothetical protein WCV59_00220 [Parcubacteria group bacterium]|jgi:hypothetical protein